MEVGLHAISLAAAHLAAERWISRGRKTSRVVSRERRADRRARVPHLGPQAAAANSQRARHGVSPRRAAASADVSSPRLAVAVGARGTMGERATEHSVDAGGVG